MDEVICRIIDLPRSVNAMTVEDENGDFNIYINAKLPHAEQQKAYRHECIHIKKNHFRSCKHVTACEQEVDDLL